MLIKDNNTELYHSGVYLGKDYSDGIKHWKYIKREWKNGKWNYYYDDNNTKYDRYKKQFKVKAYDAEQAINNDIANGIHNRAQYITGKTSKEYYKENDDYYNKQLLKDNLDKSAAKAGIYYAERYKSDLEKNKMYKLSKNIAKKTVKLLNSVESNVISKGRQRLENTLNKIGKTLSRLDPGPLPLTKVRSRKFKDMK